MKRISWISCESYIDTDLPAILRLQQYYSINLLIVVSRENNIDYEKMVYDALNKSKVIIRFIYLKHRLRSLYNVIPYLKLIKFARNFKPNIYYISYQGMPYACILYRCFLPKKTIVAACHNVTTPQGAANEKIALRTTNLWISSFKNINVFSKCQEEVLRIKYPNKRILVTPFYPKFYGNPSFLCDKLCSEKIRFLVFGNIVRYKRIDLLIDAANRLFDKGIRSFVVRIAGNCRNWSEYQCKIRYPEAFELIIKRIPNDNIPDLFADSHYAVFPYQDIAQSGSITVAFSYNVPTIVSDIFQFKEYVVDGETGLSFKSDSAESLAKTMEFAILHHYDIYPQLCKQQKDFIEKKFSDNVITEHYLEFFDAL